MPRLVQFGASGFRPLAAEAVLKQAAAGSD